MSPRQMPWIVIPAVMPGTLDCVFCWLPCWTTDVLGSVQGLTNPVSVYCDWLQS